MSIIFRHPAAVINGLEVLIGTRCQSFFGHPSDQEGIEVALQSGVDILAHTTASGGPWSSSLVECLKTARVALIPTLTLWHTERKKESPDEFEKGMNTVVLLLLRAYSTRGGQILFATDVGYIE